jgi:type IV secretory pathway VirB10-like protein
MPLATDNADTLPVDICLVATPPSKEAPVSPNHCPDSKRHSFQQTGKEKKDVEMEKTSKKEAEAARQPEAEVVKKDETQDNPDKGSGQKTAPEQKTALKRKNQSDFSTSEDEVRVALKVLTNLF